MFTQSLAHGSDEAQHELQKLTDFLEREGNLGVIPIDLQKKVLRMLLIIIITDVEVYYFRAFISSRHLIPRSFRYSG